MNLGLGIDTGGTYTDSVLIDLDSGRILSKSKALTTRSDLTIGIADSLDHIDRSLFHEIGLVSVSSTLATNSVVEGKGCRVGLIVVGRAFDRSIPVEEVIEIEGGHDLEGEPNGELDLEAARGFVLRVRDRVDAFAISSYLSVRNPGHEISLKRMMSSLTSNPIVSGHELSSSLGFNERTVTAVLNAKLIPIISDLIVSVKKVLKERRVEAPLMIVKGDGSLMGEIVSKERPVETILSGPAASLTGAMFLTGEQEAVVIDVGGTTTDIGILRKGKPRLDSEGALIGGWRTRVKAADISTSGIGGDSRVIVHDGRIHLAPLRVVPLCIAGELYPEISEKLEEVMSLPPTPQSPHLDVSRVDQAIEFFVFSKEIQGYSLSEQEARLVELVKSGPMSMREISKTIRDRMLYVSARRLEEMGIIQRIGLTPTDVLHVEGSYVEYDPEPSRIGVEIEARLLGMSSKEFCCAVKNAVIDRIATELVKKLVYEETGETTYCRVAADFLEKIARPETGIDYGCRLHLNKKIVGIGAPVATYLPAVAERLGTGLVLPEHMEVGNAVGAITGSIIESVEIVIIPNLALGDTQDPPCTLHSQTEKREFLRLTDAIEYARRAASEIASSRAVSSGADDVEVVVENRNTCMGLGKGWGEDTLVEVKIVATAVGKPYQFFV